MILDSIHSHFRPNFLVLQDLASVEKSPFSTFTRAFAFRKSEKLDFLSSGWFGLLSKV